MNFEVKNEQLILSGTEEDFKLLVDLAMIPQGTSSFILRRISCMMTADAVIGGLEITDLISKYRNIFPNETSLQYGKPFRGVLGQVKKNMQRFKKEFKYTDDQILAATQNMVERMLKAGKKAFIPQAHFFIYHKDRGSELSEECANLNNKQENLSKWK